MGEPVLCYVSGNRAYFTTCTLEHQWGDDWNDAPYEHNAGSPYEWREGRDEPEYRIVQVLFDGCWETPASACGSNSRYSVQDINAGAVAWLRSDPYDSRKIVCIKAGATLAEFAERIRDGGGDVYLPYRGPSEKLAEAIDEVPQ